MNRSTDVRKRASLLRPACSPIGALLPNVSSKDAESTFAVTNRMINDNAMITLVK